MVDKPLEACIHPLGVEIGPDGIDAYVGIHGSGADEAASDLASLAMAAGGEVEVIDVRTGKTTRSQTFTGVGDGQWGEVRNDPNARNGRLKVVYSRRSSSSDIVQ